MKTTVKRLTLAVLSVYVLVCIMAQPVFGIYAEATEQARLASLLTEMQQTDPTNETGLIETELSDSQILYNPSEQETINGYIGLAQEKAEYERLSAMSYTAMTDSEKAWFCRYVQINREYADTCAEAGYSLDEIVRLAGYMGRFAMTLAQLEAYISEFETDEKAYSHIDSFVNIIYEQAATTELEQEIRALMLAGKDATVVESAVKAAKALGTTATQFVADDDTVTMSANAQVVDIQANNISVQYGISASAVATYMAENNITAEQMNAALATTSTTSGDEGYMSIDYPEAPYMYNSAESENINTQTGALELKYED